MNIHEAVKKTREEYKRIHRTSVPELELCVCLDERELVCWVTKTKHLRATHHLSIEDLDATDYEVIS